jgi:hypothetical protein
MLVLATVMLTAAVPATVSASSHHEYSGVSFSPPEEAHGSAVDQVRGSVYLETGAGVYKFTLAGEPSNFSGSAAYIKGNELVVPAGKCVASPAAGGVAVDSSSGRIYVNSENRIKAFEASGEPAQFSSLSSNEIGGFESLCGLAVDSSGDIYATDGNRRMINVYSSSGDLITSIQRGKDLHEVAVGSRGAVYVIEENGTEDAVLKLVPSTFPPTQSATYTFVGSFDTSSLNKGRVTAIAIDPQTNDLYVDAYRVIGHYDEAGTSVERLGESGPGELFNSFGVSVADGPEGATVYASAFDTEIFVPVPVPDATTGVADEVAETTAVVHGSVNPHGLATTYQFEYGTTTAYGSSEPLPPPPAGSGKEDVAVSAALSGLAPDTTYHYRLTATNEKGTTVGHDHAFSTIAPPGISQLAVADVGSSSAALQAVINPHHSVTSYRFEYGPTEAYGSSLPVPVGEAGSDDIDHQVALHLTGLQPGVTYHWRVVASNAASPQGTASEDNTFTTFAGPAGSGGGSLPDGRAWEMVSPLDKNGADLGSILATSNFMPGLYDKRLNVTGLTVQSAPDGDRVEFNSNLAAFADPLSNGGAYLSIRGNDWSTRSLYPSHVVTKEQNAVEGSLLTVFNANLTEAVLFQSPTEVQVPTEAPEDLLSHYYTDQIDNGTFQYLASQAGQLVNVEGVSEDFQHVLIGPGSGCFEFYRDQEGKPQSRQVSVLPDGTQVVGVCGNGEGLHDAHEHDISPDGSRIVFMAGGNCGELEPDRASSANSRLFVTSFACSGHPQIYLRENGTTTRLLSAYAPGAPVDTKAGAGQLFQGADRQVTKVFFTSQTRLTAESTASHNPGDGLTTGSLGDLYRYDTEANGGAGELQDLTVDNVSPEGAQVLGVLGNSDDGSKIYFVARSDQLTGQGEPGQANLYEWDENGGSPTITYIATLQPVGTGDGSGDSADWSSEPYQRSSEVTPDGEHIMFTSKNKLTGFENAGRVEVYAYDARSHQLMCASCAGDQPPAGDSFPPFTELMVSFESRHPHAISADGRYVFFSSAAALVPADTNGRFDAYEYDTQTHRISLLSTGRNSSDSWFLGASSSGHDAFFLTRSKLVAADTDDNTDLYDARIDGGIAAQMQAPAVPACQGDSCQPLPAAPNDPTPASAGFEGPGNATAAVPAVKKPAAKKPVKKRPRRRHRRGHPAGTGRHGRNANSNNRRRHG